MSRHATTRRRSTTAAAVLALTTLALLRVPTVAGADESAAALVEDGIDGVEIGEGSIEVDEPVIGGILEFDEVTATPPDQGPVADADEPVDIGQGPIVDNDENEEQSDADPDGIEEQSETVPSEASDAICSEVLVRIAPDHVQGDHRAVAITSQMIELGVEHWVVVAWQAAAGTELTAVSIVGPTGVRTRTADLETGTAHNVVELVFCGIRSGSTVPDVGGVGGDASTGAQATDPVAAETPSPDAPSAPGGGDAVVVTSPRALASAATQGASNEPLTDDETASTASIDDAEQALVGTAEVGGLLEERHETSDDGRLDTESDPGSSPVAEVAVSDDAEALGMLEDRTSRENRSGSGLPLMLLSLLVAALAAVGARTLLHRRAAAAQTATPP